MSVSLCSLPFLTASRQTVFRPTVSLTSLAIAAAFVSALAAGSARAEGNTATTMSPPSPNAQSAMFESENSLPENSETSTYNLAGSKDIAVVAEESTQTGSLPEG